MFVTHLTSSRTSSQQAIQTGKDSTASINRGFVQIMTHVGNTPEKLIIPDKKNTPYFSAKRDSELNLNCKAKSANGETIACRHLAIHWAEQFKQTEGKVDYHLFDTLKAISSNVSVTETEKALIAPATTQLVENKAWGSVIANMFRDMKKCKDSIRTLQVTTSNHAMALGLKIKRTPGGEKWVIQFYDPNNTANHQRAAFSYNKLTKVEKLATGDFLNESSMKRYDLAVNGLSAFRDSHNAASTSTTSRLPANLLQPQVVYHAMRWGLMDALQAVAEKLRNTGASLSDRETKVLLMGSSDDGSSGLFIALENGHTNTIRAYGDMLKNARLSPEQTAGCKES